MQVKLSGDGEQPKGSSTMSRLRVHGINVPLAATDVSPEIWRALSNGTYEAKEACWVVKSVRPHDQVLELGAGIGVITSLIARIDGVHVWAFEPSPSSARLAERVIRANNLENVTLSQSLLAAGPPSEITLYIREDLWMSSILKHQAPYCETLAVTSGNIDEFILEHRIDVVVMDIEGAERDLLVHADLPGVDRIFLEFHDHLYGLDGIREIMSALAAKGFAYDPRGSSGPCVLLSRGNEPRAYQTEDPALCS